MVDLPQARRSPAAELSEQSIAYYSNKLTSEMQRLDNAATKEAPIRLYFGRELQDELGQFRGKESNGKRDERTRLWGDLCCGNLLGFILQKIEIITTREALSSVCQ